MSIHNLFNSKRAICDSTKPQKKLTEALHLSKRTQMCLKFANLSACGVFLAKCKISLVPASSLSRKKTLQPKPRDGDINEIPESVKNLSKYFPVE